MMKKANIALIIGITLFAILIYFSDIDRIINILKNVDIFLLTLGFCFLLFSYILRGVRWKILVKANVPFRECINILFIGAIGNRILPLKMGGVLKAFLLSKRTNIKFGYALSSVFIDNFVEILYVLASSLFLIVTIGFYMDSIMKLITAIFFAFTFSLFLTIMLWDFFGIKCVKRLSRKIPIIKKDSNVLRDFLTHLRNIDKKPLVESFALTIFVWLLQMISNLFLLCSIGLKTEIHILYLISTLPIVLGIFSSIPGGLGVQELSVVGVYTLTSEILTSDAASLAILMRVADILIIGLVGMYAISNIGIDLSHVEEEEII